MKKRIIAAVLAIAILASMFVLPMGATGGSDASDSVWVSDFSTPMIGASAADVVQSVPEIRSMFASINATPTFKNRTVRLIYIPTTSGSKIKFSFSNEYSGGSLIIKGATIGKTSDTEITSVTGNFTQITFSGSKSVTVAPRQKITSDEITYNVVSGEAISISLYFGSEPKTIGLYGLESYMNFSASTDMTKSRSMSINMLRGMIRSSPSHFGADDTISSYNVIPALYEIDVYGTEKTGDVVVFGDSTTTNDIATLLEAELESAGITNLNVTNASIKGNRIASDGIVTRGMPTGYAGVTRFAKDVLAQAGVEAVIVKLGINDIIDPYKTGSTVSAVTLDDLKAAFNSLYSAANAAGVALYVCPVTGWDGYAGVTYSASIDQLRTALNSWLTTTYVCDGVIDISSLQATASALNSSETVDGINPNAAGRQKLAELFAELFEESDAPVFFDPSTGDREYSILLTVEQDYYYQYEVFEANGILMILVGPTVAVPLSEFLGDEPMFFDASTGNRDYSIYLYVGGDYEFQYDVFEAEDGTLMILVGAHIAVPLDEFLGDEPMFFDASTGNRDYSIYLYVGGDYEFQYDVFEAEDGTLMILVGAHIAVPLDEFLGDEPMFFDASTGNRDYSIYLYVGGDYEFQYDVFEADDGTLMILVGAHIAVPLSEFLGDEPMFFDASTGNRDYSIYLYVGGDYEFQYDVFEAEDGTLMILVGSHIAVPLSEFLAE